MDAKTAAPLRNTPELLKRITDSRDNILKRYDALISLASTENNDRNMTANLQFQMQVETSQLIKAAEDLQTLIRNMQEMWLFGPLNTVGVSQTQQQTDETAKVVGGLLQQLAGKQDAQAADEVMADEKS